MLIFYLIELNFFNINLAVNGNAMMTKVIPENLFLC